MWTREAMTRIARKPAVLVGASSAISLMTGGGIGYVITKKLLETKYQHLADEEIAKQIEEAKAFYGRVHMAEEKAQSPQELLAEKMGQAAADALVSYQGHNIVDVEYPAESEEELTIPKLDTTINSVNIFRNSTPAADDTWDYELETVARAEHPDQPFIIHHDEFYENETEYEQAALTYYGGDSVLADNEDNPVPDPDVTVGDDNLQQFGHGSKDENVVYIRNDRLEIDFEVSYSAGKFKYEVLGFEDDDHTSLQHSYRRGGRHTKFREHDE